MDALDEAKALLQGEEDVEQVLQELEEDEEAASKSKSPSSSSPFATLREVAKISRRFIRALFSTTSHSENLILVLGCFFAAVHGAIFPFVAIIFGCMTNLFIQQSAEGFAGDNSTASVGNFTHSTPVGDTSKFATLQQLGGAASGVAAVDKVFGGVLDLVNKVLLQAFTENEVMTREEFIQNVVVTGKLFCWLAVLVFVTSFLQALCWEWIAVNQKYALRESVLRRILRQNLAWFGGQDVGELINNVFNEVSRIRYALGFQFSSILQCLSMFVASSLLGFLISWRMALVFLTPIPVLFLRALTLGEKVAAASNEARELWESAISVHSESLQKLDTVIAFGQQQDAIFRFGSRMEAAVDVFFRKFHLSALGRAILYLSVYGSYAAAFWYGCRLLQQGQITPGEIYAIFLAATMATVALTGMLSSVTVVGNAYGAAVHLHEFGNYEDGSLIDDPAAGNKLQTSDIIKGDIEFEGVKFSYSTRVGSAPEPELLRDLNFKIPAGKLVAIYGDPGRGKTTIANLILRLHDPTAGVIRIDGVDIRQLPVRELRSQIGRAAQRVELMQHADAGVDENILVGRQFVDVARLEEVKALVDPSRELEMGPNVRVEGLSATSKQKINLARALLADPPILILDDVFEEFPHSERRQIKDNVLNAREAAGKTTIFFTNDIFAIQSDGSREVDIIYLLEAGQIAPENIGSFNDLYDRGPGTLFYDTFEAAKNKQRLAMCKMVAKPDDMDGSSTEESGGKEMGAEPEPGILELYGVGATERRLFTLGLLGCVLSGAQLAVFALYFVEMFATFTKSGSALSSDAVFWAGMLLLLAVIAGVGIWLRVLFTSAAAIYLVLRIQTTAFASILRRPKAYCDPLTPRATPVTLGARVLTAVPSIRHVLEFSLPEGLSTAFALGTVSVIVCALVWQVGAILIGGVFTIFAFFAFCIYKTQRGATESFQTIDAAAACTILGGVDVIELVHSFMMHDHHLGQHADVTQPAVRKAHLQAVTFSVLYALSETIIFEFLGVSFLYGAELIENGGTEPENLFKVFFAMAICIVSFSQSVSLVPALARAAGDQQWINGLVREEAKFDSTMDALNEEGDQLDEHSWKDGSISFVQVHFEYKTPGGGVCKVLNGLNLDIQAGASVALTGLRSPGAGSSEAAPFGGSTILYLIQRFYDVTKGELQIDERNIKFLNIGDVRRRIGWVPQRPEFFEGSLAQNLAYGNERLAPGGDEDILKDVLSKVELTGQAQDLHSYRTDEFWRSLPRGTKVLLAVARALLRRPWILLLDSPTNQMSPEERSTVETVLRKICSTGDYTVVLVSNEPSTFKLCSRVQTLEGGKTQEVTSMAFVM